MKMTIESTRRFVEVREGDGGPVKCRIWEGQSESGIPVVVLIPRIAVKSGNDTGDFDRELAECKEPSADAAAIPARMIL